MLPCGQWQHADAQHDLAVGMLRVVDDILQAKGLVLRTGTAVDITLIAAPSSIKNAHGERDPAMYQTKKGKQRYFGMKAHIGVDSASGLVHTVVGTAAERELTSTSKRHLLQGEEHAAFGDSGYQGMHKRAEAAGPTWHVTMRPGKRRRLNPFIEAGKLPARIFHAAGPV